MDFTFKLEKGKPVAGKVLKPDGSPAAGVKVAMVAGSIWSFNKATLPEWATRNVLATRERRPDGTFYVSAAAGFVCDRGDRRAGIRQKEQG